jgi:hypothetical protein
MDDRSSPLLRRVGNWLAVAVLALFVAELAYLGSLDEPSALLFLGWEAGPILLALIYANASRSRGGQILFLVLAALFMAHAAFIHYDVMRSTSSTAPVALFFYPLLEYPVWLIVLGVAFAAEWRAREAWLKE